MRGFNPGAVIPKRNLADVTPRRFNLIVRLHPEKEESEYIITPDSVKRHKDSTRGWFGTIIAAGESVKRMRDMIGVIKRGTVCLFDESVSIDDPNRCFEWEDQRYVMMDIETLMGVLDKKGKIQMLGDRALVRRTKREDYKQTKSKLWIPETAKAQDLGGVVVAVGPGLPGSNGRLAMDFNPGDFVLFSKFSGTDIKIDGVDHLVLRQDRILATVEGEASRIKFS